MGVAKKMKLPIIVALGGVSSFTIQTDFNIDGTGQSRLLKETDCFYTPDQADCTENLCPGGLVSHFAGSDIGNLLPNNAKPVDFCDNFYAEWYGALTELHFFCQVEQNQAKTRINGVRLMAMMRVVTAYTWKNGTWSIIHSSQSRSITHCTKYSTLSASPPPKDSRADAVGRRATRQK